MCFYVRFRDIVPGDSEFVICDVTVDEPLQDDVTVDVRMYGEVICTETLASGRESVSLECRYEGFFAEEDRREHVSVHVMHDGTEMHRVDGELTIKSIHCIHCKHIGRDVYKWVNPYELDVKVTGPVGYNPPEHQCHNDPGEQYEEACKQYGNVKQQMKRVFRIIRRLSICRSVTYVDDDGFRRLRLHPRILIDRTADDLELACLISSVFRDMGLCPVMASANGRTYVGVIFHYGDITDGMESGQGASAHTCMMYDEPYKPNALLFDPLDCCIESDVGFEESLRNAHDMLDGCISVYHVPMDADPRHSHSYREMMHLGSLAYHVENGEAIVRCVNKDARFINIPRGFVDKGKVYPTKIICDSAFSSCTSLTNVHIPDSVREIGERAFRSCKSLACIHIPDSMEKIRKYAFGGCKSLACIHIPDSVREIGDDAFYDCTSLEDISVSPENTHFESINGVLYDKEMTVLIRYPLMKRETDFSIPDSVKEIGDLAFEGCMSLTNIHIPDSVKWIGYRAFSGCTSLTSIHIPDSVKGIGACAFEDCTSLYDVSKDRNIVGSGMSAKPAYDPHDDTSKCGDI